MQTLEQTISKIHLSKILVLHPIRDSSLVVSEQTQQTQLAAYLLREPQKTLRVVIKKEVLYLSFLNG
jgi:hypothetical protein